MKLLLIRATFLALLALGATAGAAAADDLVPTGPVDGPAATEPAVDIAEAAADVARPVSVEVAQTTTPVARELVRQARPVTREVVRRVRPVVETGTQTVKDIVQPLAEPIAPVLETLERSGNELPLVGSLIWPGLPTRGLDPEPGADPTGDRPVSPTTDPIPSGPTVAPPPLTPATGGVTGTRPDATGGSSGTRATTTAVTDVVSAMPLGPAHSPLTQTGSPMSAGIGHASTGGHWVAVLIGALLAAAIGIGWRLFESALKPPGLLPAPAVPPA